MRSGERFTLEIILVEYVWVNTVISERTSGIIYSSAIVVSLKIHLLFDTGIKLLNLKPFSWFRRTTAFLNYRNIRILHPQINFIATSPFLITVNSLAYAFVILVFWFFFFQFKVSINNPLSEFSPSRSGLYPRPVIFHIIQFLRVHHYRYGLLLSHLCQNSPLLQRNERV